MIATHNVKPAIAEGTLGHRLSETAERAQAYAGCSSAVNTRRAYRSAWTCFETWCTAHDLAAMPAAVTTVGLYMSDAAERLKVSTLNVHCHLNRLTLHWEIYV